MRIAGATGEAMMKSLLTKLLLALLAPAAMAAESSRSEFSKAMAATPDTARGEELFRNCVSCHGSDGSGDVAGSVPRIAGQYRGVLVRQILDFRRGKRWDYNMEGITASHNAIPQLKDVADVAGYVSELPWNGTRGTGDGHFAERGAGVFSARCASCHGAAGEGDEADGTPRLGGQHAAYLSRQIYDAVDGRRPLLMRSHKRHFEALVFEEVRGVADYLSRIGADRR
jgi:cytochrome c553